MPNGTKVKYQRRPRQDPYAGKFGQKMSVKSLTATNTVKSKDVDDFDRMGLPGRPHAVVESGDPIHLISRYSELGKGLKDSFNFRKVAEQMVRVAEVAEKTLVEKASDWFDEYTIRRNIKEMKTYATQFAKIAEDLDTLHQRATALYDDMGNVLARYFEIVGEDDEDYDPKFDKKLSGSDNLEQPYAGPDRGAKDMGNAGQQGWTEQLEEDEETPFDYLEEIEPNRWRCTICNFPSEGRGGMPLADAQLHLKYAHGKFKDMKKEGRGLALPGSQNYKYNYKTKGIEEDDVGFAQNKLAIAQRAIRKPEALAKVMTGMSRDEAREVIKKYGARTMKEARRALFKEAIRKMVRSFMREAVDPQTKEQQLRNIVQTRQFGKVDDQMLDVQTAHAILTVLDALSPENKQKYLKMPVSKMASVAWKLIH